MEEKRKTTPRRKTRRPANQSAEAARATTSEKAARGSAKPAPRKRTATPAAAQTGRKKTNEKQPTVRIIPLGGIGEVGKNMTVIEYENDIIVVDCGMTFPQSDMLGIDYVIPDATYLQNNKEKIRGFVFTHGHEDHIGATPFILRDFKNVPIYGGRLTLALIEHKMEEHRIKGIQANVIKPGSKVKLGCFTVTFLKVSHSIADAYALAIETPVGLILHTGDFKIDYTPLDGEMMDLAAFANLGRKGVQLLMSESTNSERPGYTMSEQRVAKSFDDLFGQATGRIFVATFASNVSRIQQIIKIAERRGKKVYMAGRSLERITEIATEIGYLKMRKGTLLNDKQLDFIEPDQVVIITTGSQGEPLSGLVRISNDEHRTISIRPDDMVILSSSPIPGNEKAVTNMIDRLIQKGVKVVNDRTSEVHVSGHACQEEQKLMMALTKPKFFMPIHGEFHHLRQHAITAEEQGILPEHMVIPQIGRVIELTKNGIAQGEEVPGGAVFVDGSGIGDIGNVVLRDRKMLSEDGLFIVTLAVDEVTGALISGPELISRGFVYVRESEALLVKARTIVINTVRELENKRTPGDYTTLKNSIRSNVRNFLYQQTKRSPMILPIILDIHREETEHAKL